MKKKCFVIAALLCLVSGCDLLGGASNLIIGWDVSACVSGYETCLELFSDNVEKFDNGFMPAIDLLSVGD
jgi:hypothetical protein